MSRPVWIWRPDWSGGVVERLAWSTDVQSSRDGSEERHRSRQVPRQSMQFSTIVSEDEARKLDSLLWAHQSDEWLMPVWWDVSRLTADAAPGAFSLSLDIDYRDFRAGSDAWILLLDPSTGDYHASTVSLASSDTIGLDTATTQDWPEGSLAYPARIVRIGDSQGLDHPTAGRSTLGVRAETVDTEAAIADTDPDGDGSSTTYRSLAVLDLEPNRKNPIGASFERLTKRVDFGIGRWAVADQGGRAFTARSQEHQLKTRAKRWAFRQWLEHLAGRYQAFWCSTHEADLELVADIGSTDTTIRVGRLDYSTRYAQQLGRQDIDIKLKDGTHYYRRITGATTVDADTEDLTIDSALGAAVAASDVAKISWLEQVRLGADAVELSHRTAAVTEIAMPLRLIR